MPIKFRGQEQGQGKTAQKLECRIRRKDHWWAKVRMEGSSSMTFLNICGRLWISFVSWMNLQSFAILLFSLKLFLLWQSLPVEWIWYLLLSFWDYKIQFLLGGAFLCFLCMLYFLWVAFIFLSSDFCVEEFPQIIILANICWAFTICQTLHAGFTKVSKTKF